jgi:ATP-dependent DNA helicase PIF1
MLNQEQSSAVVAILEGKNVFLTGPPGTGKSYTLKEIIHKLKDANKKIAITSSTGCSAILINGQTVHSFMGMGIGNMSAQQVTEKLKKFKSKFNKIYELETLIIDEISMIDCKTFDNISGILQLVRSDKRPFGGVQVVLVGDFCQLAPVQSSYCFLSDTWKELELVYVNLVDLIRQKDDTEFQTILQEVRFGKCTKNTYNKLKSLEKTQFGEMIPTKLYSLNVDVNTINSTEFKKTYKSLYGKKSVKDANIIQCFPLILDNDLTLPHCEQEISDILCFNAFTNDKKIKTDDFVISLFKGLRVMVTRNINFDTGLINGTLGVITALTPSSVTIVDMNKTHHVINYHTDKNDNNVGKDATYVKFMPIKLAYALSIHKSQGSTLDCIEVDGSSFIFAPGQLYTALSRGKKLSSLKITNLDRNSFICHNEVKAFYKSFV